MEVKEVIKETFVTWNKAVEFHNSEEYIAALENYDKIEVLSGRMLYNMACAYIKLGTKPDAIESLTRAIHQDNHLAVAYFQRGTLYLQGNRITESISDLQMSRDLLRGNSFIDYKPLGLLVRLSSFQVTNNLALANIKAGRLSEARNILMDAFHDADDLQRKIITTALCSIDEGTTEKIQTMLVSADRVFTPPKSVTKNIEKPGIVRKAKVISAVNADDRNATFEGSKRVRELKLNPVLTEQTQNPLKRFVKNRAPRSPPSHANVNGVQAFKGIKSSKSMSDLQADDNSVLTGSNSPLFKIKRLFQKRTSDTTVNSSSPQLRMNRSCGDLEKQSSPEVSNPTKLFQRSPLMGVKKLLNDKKKICNQSKSQDEQLPVLTMRSSASVGDLRQSADLPFRGNIEEGQSQNITHNRNSYEKLNFNSKGNRNSLGSVFGNYLTIVNQTLSRSCDVLTAVVTPTEYENEVFSLDPTKDNSDKSETSEFDDTAHFYINVDNEINAETDDVTFNNIDFQKELKNRLLGTGKLRPPPPSYPPPPLPPHILKA